MSAPDRRAMLDRADRAAKPANDNDAALMRRIDALFTAWPFLKFAPDNGDAARRRRAREPQARSAADAPDGDRRARAEAENEQARAGPPDLSLSPASIEHDGCLVLLGVARGGSGEVRQTVDSTPTRARSSPRPPEVRGRLSQGLRRRPGRRARHRRVGRLLQRAASAPGARRPRADGGLARGDHRRQGCGYDGQRFGVAHRPTAATADAACRWMIERNHERSAPNIETTSTGPAVRVHFNGPARDPTALRLGKAFGMRTPATSKLLAVI